MDKLEFFLKITATACAVLIFGVLGLGALYLSPTGPVNQMGGDMDGNGFRAFEGGGGAVLRDELPTPPDTSVVHEEATDRANIRLYESRLAPEGLIQFYSDELPRRGWERARRMPAEALSDSDFQPGTEVLYFTSGRKVCIINIEEKDFYRTLVSTVKTVERQQRPDQ